MDLDRVSQEESVFQVSEPAFTAYSPQKRSKSDLSFSGLGVAIHWLLVWNFFIFPFSSEEESQLTNSYFSEG